MRKETLLIRFLYQTVTGRSILKILVQPWVSRKVGIFLNSKFSRWLVPVFVKKNGINMDEYEKKDYKSFNDFFIRKRNKERIDMTPNHLISPCDGYLSVYSIEESRTYKVKNTEYHLEQLLDSAVLAQKFSGGYCMIFRMTPRHCHRYCYICDGVRQESRKIAGKLHCVRPVAYTSVPVFVENNREYVKIRSDLFGYVVQMEIGALLVGKIYNHQSGNKVLQGQEKGYFEFGGSTILILLEKNRVKIEKRILECSMQDQETEVRMGTMVGTFQKEVENAVYE